MDLPLFATVPKGMETLLADELRNLGAQDRQVTRAGVGFRGSLAIAYRACLWSRLANRILLTIAQFHADSPDLLYEGVRAIDWTLHLPKAGTLAVDFNAAESRIKHTRYGAQKVKDAIVDQLRERHGVRPSVDLDRPDLRINVYLFKNQARLSLDLSGQSLHRRGYREDRVIAPLKENLAAAILLEAGWPALAASGAPFLDPLCGSATLPIEAAYLAGDIAPGWLRDYYGFFGWLGHDAAQWAELQSEAQARREAGADRIPPIVGYDTDRRAVRAAIANVTRAGLLGKVHIERQDLSAAQPSGHTAGLLVANPPYGERLGQDEPLPKLYATLGTVLKERFGGWRAVVFTGNPELAHRLRVKAARSFELYNGALPCKGFEYQLPAAGPAAAPLSRPLAQGAHDTVTAGAQMFANRLHKDLRTIGRWARRNEVACYRLYDAELPEFALAIDLYRGDRLWAHVQEYRAPATVDPQKAEARLQAALRVIPDVLAIDPAQMFCKRRERQRGRAQYEKLGAAGAFHAVTEGPCRYLVNFTDYLDTGLFLDHRHTRALLREWSAGKRFLNLFAYTGTATVAAALGGALSTTTVDLSHTYSDWAQRNLALNTAPDQRHRFIQADCREWLIETARTPQRYDLIFLDPPTFSNSKRMDGNFDVQRDHVELIGRAVQLLARDGVLIFSTNRQRFKLDAERLGHLHIEVLTAATIPPDFARHPTIHQCWRLTRT